MSAASVAPLARSGPAKPLVVASHLLGAKAIPAAIFVAWLALTLTLVLRHEMWRDEVRALSFAIDPPTLVDMVMGLRGEGHPTLWYLILRAGYALTGSMLVLPVAAFLAAAAAMAFFLWRAPFQWPIKALVAASGFATVEFTVMARNYGISMLPIFVFAAYYDAWRSRGVRLGLLLVVLANTNVHSAVVVGALLLMWLVDTVSENGLRWSRALGTFIANAAIASAGVIVAALCATGPGNDAISGNLPRGTIADVLWAIVHPGIPMEALAPILPKLVVTALIVACLLGFVRRPALLAGGVSALLVLSLLFTIGYAGGYRHVSIWLLLLIGLAWIAESRRLRSGAGPDRWHTIGNAGLVAMFSVQAGLTAAFLPASARLPWSNSRTAAEIIKADPRLTDAIILAEPDFLIEPFRYYGLPRTYLLREQRFGHVVNFTRRARLKLSLGDVLETAGRLRAENGVEVVILLPPTLNLEPTAPAQAYRVGYNWTFTATPDEIAAFRARTELLARLDDSIHGEDYAMFRLRPEGSN